MLDSLCNYMSSPHFFMDTFPNWLQGLGTIVAIIGIIIAWKSLKRDNIEQQAQMNILMKQAEALGKQTEALNESMKIDSKILAALTKHFDKSAEIERLNQEKERLRVKPEIKISESANNNIIFQFNVINDGSEEARNVEVQFQDVPEEIIEIRNYERVKDFLRPNGNGIQIIFEYLSAGKISIPTTIGFALVNYQDMYNNNYTARFQIFFKNGSFSFRKIIDEYFSDFDDK